MKNIRFLSMLFIAAFAVNHINAMDFACKLGGPVVIGAGALSLLTLEPKVRKSCEKFDEIMPVTTSDAAKTIALGGAIYAVSKLAAPDICKEKAAKLGIRLSVAALGGVIINRKLVTPIVNKFESVFGNDKPADHSMLTGASYIGSYLTTCFLAGLINNKFGTNI